MSENEKIICARDCLRKSHLKWLGGEERNSSRKPEKRLQKNFKSVYEVRERACWGQTHMWTEALTDWNDHHTNEVYAHERAGKCDVLNDAKTVISVVFYTVFLQ